jgi:hypothetical protein
VAAGTTAIEGQQYGSDAAEGESMDMEAISPGMDAGVLLEALSEKVDAEVSVDVEAASANVDDGVTMDVKALRVGVDAGVSVDVEAPSAEVESDILETKRRLRVEMEAYSSKYKMLPWLEEWNTAVEESKAHVQWLRTWWGKRKAPEAEMPQRKEMPRRSKASNDEAGARGQGHTRGRWSGY